MRDFDEPADAMRFDTRQISVAFSSAFGVSYGDEQQRGFAVDQMNKKALCLRRCGPSRAGNKVVIGGEAFLEGRGLRCRARRSASWETPG
jgi:hypothetical protein